MFEKLFGAQKTTKPEWEKTRFRLELGTLAKTMSQRQIAEWLGINVGNVCRIISGRQVASDVTIERAYETNLVSRPQGPDDDPQPDPEPQPEPVPAYKIPKKEKSLPLQSWAGKTLPTAKAGTTKGYTADKVRRMCQSGKLNYTMSGRRYMVCLDAKWDALRPTALGKKIARMEERLRSLKAENRKLKAELQQKFNFGGADLMAGEAVPYQTQPAFWEAEEVRQ